MFIRCNVKQKGVGYPLFKYANLLVLTLKGILAILDWQFNNNSHNYFVDKINSIPPIIWG